jgi:hypothetical protein
MNSELMTFPNSQFLPLSDAYWSMSLTSDLHSTFLCLADHENNRDQQNNEHIIGQAQRQRRVLCEDARHESANCQTKRIRADCNLSRSCSVFVGFRFHDPGCGRTGDKGNAEAG